MREGRNYSNQVRLKCPDGSWRTVKGQAVAQRNDVGEIVTVIGALLDVTDIERVSEMLHRTESRYRLLVENVTEIIAEITPPGTITFITPSCRAILGYEPDELIGHRSLEFTHPADIAKAIETYTNLAAAGPGTDA